MNQTTERRRCRECHQFIGTMRLVELRVFGALYERATKKDPMTNYDLFRRVRRRMPTLHPATLDRVTREMYRARRVSWYWLSVPGGRARGFYLSREQRKVAA